MKKIVLPLLIFLATGLAAHAQWALQPFTYLNTIAPYPPNAATLNIVDAQTVWATSINQYSGVNYGNNEVAHTTNGGTTWAVQTVPGIPFCCEIINSVAGLSGTTALICTSSSFSAGHILKTTDGGITWTTRSTATQYTASDSYADFLVAFSATELLCVGDPTAGTNDRFELYRSLDAGNTWTLATTAAMPAGLTGEYATAYHWTRLGDNVWFSTNKGRVFRSTDRGLTWAAARTGLASVSAPETFSVAFRDALNGLVFEPTGGGLARTTDGGATWAPVAYTGPAHAIIRGVPGTGLYLSVGQGPDAGTSVSRDNGTTWTALETTRSHFDLAVFSPTVAWSAALNYTATTREGLGAYKLTSTALGTAAAAALPASSLQVYPNPSADGRYQLALAAGIRPEHLTVLDALGRTVLARPLAAGPLPDLDLSAQPAGLYTLLLRTSQGVARQQLERQ